MIEMNGLRSLIRTFESYIGNDYGCSVKLLPREIFEISVWNKQSGLMYKSKIPCEELRRSYDANLLLDKELYRVYKTIFEAELKQTLKEEAEMADRRVIIKKKNIDQRKVKRPQCNVHTDSMVYDSLSGKWRCNVEGCNVVARPKRAEDDKTLIMGKGGVQLRLVCEDNKHSLVAISDDNVALDLTNYTDINKLLAYVREFARNNEVTDGEPLFVGDLQGVITASLTVLNPDKL